MFEAPSRRAGCIIPRISEATPANGLMAGTAASGGTPRRGLLLLEPLAADGTAPWRREECSAKDVRSMII